MVERSGIDIAVETTIAIAKHLPNKQDKELYKKTVQSIFDDQLQMNTSLNRAQRRMQLSRLNKELKKVLK